MSRIGIEADDALRITHLNGVQYHQWPADFPDAIGEARKVAIAWEDDELLAEIDAVEAEVNDDEPKPKRGPKPKALTPS